MSSCGRGAGGLIVAGWLAGPLCSGGHHHPGPHGRVRQDSCPFPGEGRLTAKLPGVRMHWQPRSCACRQQSQGCSCSCQLMCAHPHQSQPAG